MHASKLSAAHRTHVSSSLLSRVIGAALVAGCICLGSAPPRADVAPATQTGKPVVAVLPFSSPTAYNAMGRNAQATFVTKLVQSKKVRVVQADMVMRMLRSHGLSFTGTMDPALLKAAGSFLKADYMLAGKLRFAGDAYVLSAHVMNVKTLETTMAEDVDFSDVTKMRVAVRVLAQKIAGSVTGSDGGGSGSKTGMFLNVNPRAFYDTSDFCIRALGYIVSRYQFTGTVEESEDSEKMIKVKGYTGSLKPGIPLDVFSTSGIGGDEKSVVVYVTKLVPGGFEARYRMQLDDGVELGAKVTNANHRWTVAVGNVEDEVEDNDELVKRFRSALLEKMSEGTRFQQIESPIADGLAKMSSRQQRFMAYKQLFQQGVDLVLEGKFYGGAGSRRAHFKLYSTLTGELLAEPKFETRL